jgi:alpha-L-rhamnosidase
MSADDERNSESQPDRSHDQFSIDRRDYLQYAGAAAVGSFTATGGAAAQSGNAGSGHDTTSDSPLPIDLRVEYATDPLGVDVSTPRLSWTTLAPGHGWNQSAYHVLVASSRSKLKENNGDVWDSGRVNSSQSVNIKYGGPSLESKTRYYWKVRTWNADGEATAWSDAAYWETGLLNDEWGGDWIGADVATDDGELVGLGLVGLGWTDYTFEVDFEIVSENVGFVFRAQGDEDFYMWQIIGSDDPILREHVFEGGGYEILNEVPISDVTEGQHHIQITVEGNQFTTSIDGTEVSTTTDDTFSSGTIGFREDSSERALFDNVAVTAPDGSDLYEDDFSDSVESAFPASRIQDGVLNVNNVSPLLPDESWTDYTFGADFEIVSENAGFVFRAQGDDDLYMWQIIGKDPENPILRTHTRENGSYEVLENIPIGNAVGDVTEGRHRIEITAERDEFTTVIDGTEVNSTTNATFSSGTIGFREDPSERALFDNVVVTALDGTVLYEDDFSNPSESQFAVSRIQDGVLNVGDTGPLLLGELQPEYKYPDPLLRTETELSGEIERARAYVAGLGFHELYVNGERIGEQVLNPGRTVFEKTVLYDTYDVTDVLSSGTNALGITLGRARYGELAGNWGWDDVSWWSNPELLFRLDIEFRDGSTKTIVSDENWSTTDGPVRRDSLINGEVYDARKERHGWTESGFDDTDWERAVTVDGPVGDLTSQMVQPIEKQATIAPVEVTEPESGVYVFDMGEMLTGWPRLTVEGPAGTEVILRTAERLEGFPDERTGTIDPQPGVNRYIHDGEGTEVYEPRFTYQGFRYLQVEGYPGEPTQDDIQGVNVHTSIDEDSRSSFACSSDLLNQIHENTQRAVLNNAHSVPTDTPVFEKMAYGGDGIATAETTMYNYDAARFYTKWIHDLADAQENGLIPSIAPAVEGRYRGRNATAAGWGSAYVLIPWWVYRYYDDERVLEENYEGMKAYVDVLESQADNLVHPGGFGDYNAPGAFGEPPEDSAIVGTAYFYRDAELLSEIASLLGNEAEANSYATLAASIKDAFNNAFLNGEENIYRTGETDEYRQTSNLFPLAFDIVPDDRREAVVDNLVYDVMERRNGHLNTGSQGTKLLLQVLTESGHHDVAYTVATQTDYPSWGHWVENGFTSLLEDWNISPRTRSLNHQYYGSIDEWFYQYLAGVREPADPGFKRVEINPEPVSGLDWAEATVETVRGIIEVHWERESTSGQNRNRDGISLDTTIPGNSTGIVKIPTFGGEKVRVRESGKPIWNNGHQVGRNHPGIKNVERDGDAVVVEIGSGDYNFELKQLGKARR